MTGPFEALDDLGPEELRQRLHALHAIIARAPVPIAIAHDPDCRFVSANRALAVLLQLPSEANVSLTPPPGTRSLYRIQRDGEDIPADELPMQYAIAHRTPVSNEVELVRADGTVAYVQNDVEPLYDAHGQIYGCISVCVDVTDRKLAERALRDADRRKDEFLATLSHELRNPLAPIRTALEVMRLSGDNGDLARQARMTMERQLGQLVRITDDLLDIARITQNKVELRCERIDLRAVLHSAVEATRPMIDAQHHELTIELPPHPLWAVADFTRLAQVFSNLLNNAAKYTNPGGRIRLMATAADDSAIVEVGDTGIGIPPAMIPRVFDMFRQLQAFRDRTHGGLGVGLTLARRLVELHHGRIEATSDGPGRGSTFRVVLPLARPDDAAGSGPGDREPAARRGCRVLIAEDNADAAEMMQLMLQLNGHEVEVAADGEQAIAIAERFRPAIAFLDIGMPRVDGYEAARQIRERLGRDVVLVALTGWGQDEDKQLSKDAGFDHHLTKPPEPEVVEQLIASCLDNPGRA